MRQVRERLAALKTVESEELTLPGGLWKVSPTRDVSGVIFAFLVTGLLYIASKGRADPPSRHRTQGNA